MSSQVSATKLRIASRKSDLARWQSVWVAERLKSHWKNQGLDLEIDFAFSESLGDKNQSDPLWKMPEKGVFTSDLSQGLLEGRHDLVVHSWKDLPLESDANVLGAPGRMDARDQILFRKGAVAEWQRTGKLTLLSSSPRRERNLTGFLKEYLPHAPSEVRFIPVRGNIPTRILKLLEAESGAHALVIAKAAIERLLAPPTPEFAEVAQEIAAMLEDTLAVTAPLSINPPAPAQGALALEARPDDESTRRLIAPIVDAIATADVRAERAELARHGGGCHQKIGVSVVTTQWGTLHTVRGISDRGVVLDARRLGDHAPRLSQGLAQGPTGDAPSSAAWSTSLLGITLFDRAPLAPSQPLQALAGWYVSHPDALPENIEPALPGTPRIWCSGLMTWKHLARRGFWVEGCDESLGESEHPGLTKLGHADSPELGAGVATYRLIPRPAAKPLEDWKIEGKIHFFWRSISQFLRVSAECPQILEQHHACGMGSTARFLRARVKNLEVCLDENDWRQKYGITNLKNSL